MEEYYYQISNSLLWSCWPLTLEPWTTTIKINKSGYSILDKNYIKPKLLSEMTRIGLTPRHVAFFYIPPNLGHGDIHIDSTRQDNIRQGTDHCAVNWVVTDQDWMMNYFKPRAGLVTDVSYIEKFSYHEIRDVKPYSYVKFNLEDMESVCRFNWDINPMLIKTDVPHNVEMLSDHGIRWCASIRFNVNDFDQLKSIFEAHY